MIPRIAPIFLLIALLVACNDPTLIGEELLTEDGFDLERTDTVTITTQTVTADTLTVYDGAARLTHFLVGNFDDPAFGRTEGQLFTQVRSDLSLPSFADEATIDSIIWRVVVDKEQSYGDITVPYTFEVYRIAEPIDAEQDYTAGSSFPLEDTPLTTLTVTPSMIPDTVTLIGFPSTTRVDTSEVPGFLRFDLTEQLRPFFESTSRDDIQNDTTLTEQFPGLAIRVVGDTPGLVDLRFAATVEPNGLAIYYTNPEDESRIQYDLSVTSVTGVRVPNYRQDPSGSPLAEVLNVETDQDSLTFVQGLNGPVTNLNFPYAESFPDRAQINRATLTMRVAFLTADGQMSFELPDQMALTEVTEDGLEIIDDLLAFRVQTSTGTVFNPDTGRGFGGQFIAGENGEPGTYRFTMSRAFAQMVRGDISNTLQLSQIERAIRGNRVIFYGEAHPLYAPKLEVTYTAY